MIAPRVAFLDAPGTNCLRETRFAFQSAGAHTSVLPLFELQQAKNLSQFDGFVLAGGFSFADDLGAGRVAAAVLKNGTETILEAFALRPRPILGICNGFQILQELGAFGIPRDSATLRTNHSRRFECRWTELQSQTAQTCSYFQGLEAAFCWPIAHSEGRFVADSELIDVLAKRGQIALKYVANSEEDYPSNPNGSVANVAGLCDESGYILGLMPHPERCLTQYKKPQRRRTAQRFFKNLVESMRKQI